MLPNTSVNAVEYNDIVDEFIKAVGLRGASERFDQIVTKCVHDIITHEARYILKRMAEACADESKRQFMDASVMANAALESLADKALAEIIKRGVFGNKFERLIDATSGLLAIQVAPLVIQQLEGDLAALRKVVHDNVMREVGQMTGRELENTLSAVLKKELLAGMDKIQHLERQLGLALSKAERRIGAVENKAGIAINWQDNLNNYDVR